MAQIAERSGIGLATVYKYLADADAILVARHERHVARHTRNTSSRRCLHAISAAGGLKSRAALERLVTVILDGLRPRGWTESTSQEA